MPKWSAEEYQTKSIYPLIFMILSLLFLSFSINSFLSSNSAIVMITLFTSFLITIYISGRFYGELNAKKDFIDISTQGIKYRETPGLYQGWLSTNNMIRFEDVKTTDIIKIKNIFNPDHENLAIYLIPVKGRPIVLGTKLSQDQIMKVALALKGSVVISNALQRFIGDETQVKDILDKAKGIWKSIKNTED
ncbi:MAG: hypothetical protein HeimC2_01170 [Candidatus Heimdallarchaeota archaeon LC_2]|nr:MAG: hypothetical protein HeimC2_01170 [Candidatus Heimdallarchaeota archaeon LC_2]